MIMGQYEAVYMPNHPKATKTTGCVYVHVLVAEKILGRHIISEVVHHIDENKLNNDPSNIMVFKSRADHIRFHKGCLPIEIEKNIFICNKKEKQKKSINKQGKIERIKQRKVERPNRESLKEMIRTTPFTTIGKNFGVSDNAIRKWCKSYDLPFKSSEIKKYSDEEWEKI